MDKKKIALVLAVVIVPVSVFAASHVYASQKKRRQLEDKRRTCWNSTQRRIRADYEKFHGSAGIVVKDLDSGWETAMNQNTRFAAASLLKIPIMAACYKAAAEKRISLDAVLTMESGERTSGSGVLKTMPGGSSFTVEQLIELMITQSDNTATNMLVDLLTMEYLNNFFRKEGLKGTSMRRKMMDFSGRRKGIENYTTARDISILLEKMYRGRFLNPDVSRTCMRLLLRQKMRDRIPRKLPRETPVAHKTGLERRVCHDAGVIYAPGGHFLVCVLTRSRSGAAKVKEFISRIALYAYRTYEPLRPKEEK